MTIRVVDAARYLDGISGWHLSNLEMQKLLYLADMMQTGATGERLLDENFQAWDYGPVLPSLYHRCKGFGSKAVPDIFWDANPVGVAEAGVISNVWNSLRGQTPGQLVDNTHWQGGAWARRYQPGANVQITREDMIAEYQGRVAAHAAAATT